MGRITSNIGLITGLPITDTVDQLVKIQARPRDLLVSRNETASLQLEAITNLTGLTLSLQVLAKNLAKSELYTETKATSSNASALSVTVTGTPAVGSYTFTPIQQAQAHQLISSGLASDTEPLGPGEFTFRFGGEIDEGISLDMLNGGAGFQPGKIRITDRSGASAEIDLRYARTIDDVLEAINSNSAINVTATTVGDRLQLTDHTGQTVSNLKVQEVGNTQTAASLGLAGINTASDTAIGEDILSLYEGLRLDLLNDGTGVGVDRALPDLTIHFRDGTSTTIDLRPLDTSTMHASGQTNAAAGLNAAVLFTARNTGSSLAGVNVVFENNDGITAGSETVAYDENTKTLTFQIDEGNTTAEHIVAALNNDPLASGFFTASLPPGSNGTGLISTADTTTTALPSEKPQHLTLGSVLQTLNSAAPSKLRAEIVDNRIVLTDLTADNGGTFQVTAPFDSPALEALGLNTTADGDTLTGRKLLGGLKTSLVRRLNGGAGFDLGVLSLTDRAGNSANIDLSGAETIDDILAAINGAGIGVVAQVNDARNGIQLRDTSGGSGNLIVASGDAKNTAEALGLAYQGTASTVNSGNLHKQVVSEITQLSQLNGGAGVPKGSFRITASNGASFKIDLSRDNITTVGDVIAEINRIAVGVKARINDTGDGILLYDTTSGAGTLTVSEEGGNTAAALHLLGEAKQVEIDGETRTAIDGSTTFRIQLDADDTLDDLIQAINKLGVGVTAAKFNDGSSVQPYRLSLTSTRSGLAARMVVDTSNLGFSMQTAAQARDALLLVGSPDSGGSGIVASSATGSFSGVVPGLTLRVLQAQTSPVTITVESATTKLVAGVQAFVDDYNSLREGISKLTAFNAESGRGSLLSGDATVLRLESDLSRLLSGRFFGVGSIQALGTLGISFNDDGTLSLDSEKLKAKFAEDPAAVEQFFTDKTSGFAHKLDNLLEQLAGADQSLLVSRMNTLSRKIELNAQRIEFLNTRLEIYREQTTLKFIRLEEAIAKIQNNLSTISQIAALPPLK